MSGYQNVLVALDVFAEYDPIIQRALEIAGSPNKINLIYVAYPQTNFEPYGFFLEKDFSAEVRQQALERLHSIADGHHIPRTHTEVSIGSAAEEIHNAADRLNSDLIVLGTHGQHGVQLLLGSTANAVLHGVKQDVLAVRV